MSARAGNRRFKTSLPGTVLVLAFVALCVQLGLWQIGRAGEKTALLEQFEQGATATVELNYASMDTLPRYQRVHCSGRYDPQQQILLDNMPSQQSQPGFRVLTPLQLSSGEWLLVDRGWVPMGPTRDALPATDVADTPRQIVGRLDNIPEPGLRLAQPPAALPAKWPYVTSFPRRDDLQRLLDRPLPARIVRLDASQPDGYERTWSPNFGLGPRGHIAYAVQWFAFAAAAVAIYLVLGFRRGAHEAG